jgi:hypothetical protein
LRHHSLGWPFPMGMDVEHDGNGYELKGLTYSGSFSAYCRLILAYFF